MKCNYTSTASTVTVKTTRPSPTAAQTSASTTPSIAKVTQPAQNEDDKTDREL